MDCLRTRRTAPTAGPLPGTRGAIFLPSISFPPATPVSPPGAHWQCGPTACCAWPLRCRRGREEWGGVCRALRVVLEGRALGETGVGSHDTAQLTGCFLCPAADTCRRQRIGRGGGRGADWRRRRQKRTPTSTQCINGRPCPTPLAIPIESGCGRRSPRPHPPGTPALTHHAFICTCPLWLPPRLPCPSLRSSSPSCTPPLGPLSSLWAPPPGRRPLHPTLLLRGTTCTAGVRPLAGDGTPAWPHAQLGFRLAPASPTARGPRWRCLGCR